MATRSVLVVLMTLAFLSGCRQDTPPASGNTDPKSNPTTNGNEPDKKQPRNQQPATSGVKGIADLVEHFTKAGLPGKYHARAADLLGAREGGDYKGEGFSFEMYVFNDQAKAETLEKEGFIGQTCHRNGKFILMGDPGDKRVLPAFKQFDAGK